RSAPTPFSLSLAWPMSRKSIDGSRQSWPYCGRQATSAGCRSSLKRALSPWLFRPPPGLRWPLGQVSYERFLRTICETLRPKALARSECGPGTRDREHREHIDGGPEQALKNLRRFEASACSSGLTISGAY